MADQACPTAVVECLACHRPIRGAMTRNRRWLKAPVVPPGTGTVTGRRYPERIENLEGPWKDYWQAISSRSSQFRALVYAPSPVRRQLSSITCRYESFLRHVRHCTLIPCCGDNPFFAFENMTGNFGKFLPHAMYLSGEITTRYSIANNDVLRSRICPHMVNSDSPNIFSPQECSQTRDKK